MSSTAEHQRPQMGLYKVVKEKTFEQHVIALQRIFRRNKLDAVKLHRKNLVDRVVFERSLLIGAFRLMTQGLIFMLLISALYLAGDSQTKKGIFDNLHSHFDFDYLETTSDTKDFGIAMKFIAEQSKEFFVLSSKYWRPDGGSVELLGPMTTFNAPQVIGKLDLSIQIPSFSFTAWVGIGPQFVRGYIARKRIKPAGDGNELACWGWHLSDTGGPALHYGAQDFFSFNSDERQERVVLERPAPIPRGEQSLLTMVVEHGDGGWTASFYRNLEWQGSAKLPRPLTDCFNNQEGKSTSRGIREASGYAHL